MKNHILLAAISLLILALACTNENTLPSGFDALQRKNTGELRVTTIEATQTAQYRAEVNPGLTAKLLLGRYDGITSRVLLRFTGLATVDTASVTAATLSLTQLKRWGDGAGFSCTVHAVNAEWDEQTVQWADVRDQYDPGQSIATFQVQPQDSADIIVSLPPGLVNGWVDGAANYGFILDFSNAAMAVELRSVENNADYPTLVLAYTTKAGVADTVTVSPTQDVSLFEFDQINPENTLENETSRFWLDNARGYQALLRFDVTQFPKEATIHQALLTLPIDTGLSSTSVDGLGFKINALVNDSTWQDPAEMLMDSVYSAPTGTALGTLEQVVISATPQISYMSNIVQRWTTGAAKNYGIIVQSTGYGSDFSKVAFYNGKDGSAKPTLRITYSLPASARF